jgi:16S rRNA (adenine1518-N6/adenine1519-N6)-dimethyltransferase
VQADCLTEPWPAGELLLAGNLPYNISSPIFFRLLEYRHRVRTATVMIQREVAQRICAAPGNKTYGILSVLLGYYFKPRYCFTVSPGVFFPPPKVDSAVIRLVRIENPPPTDEKAFFRIVKAAFNQRRKTLSNALKSENVAIPTEWQGLRAEQLTPEQFAQLAAANRQPTG